MISFKQLFSVLKLLPTITLALLLGSGMVVTAFAIWFTAIIAYNKWGPDNDPIRLNYLGMGLIACFILIGLIIATLAWGKVQKLGLQGPNGFGANLEFDDEKDEPHG